LLSGAVQGRTVRLVCVAPAAGLTPGIRRGRPGR